MSIRSTVYGLSETGHPLKMIKRASLFDTLADWAGRGWETGYAYVLAAGVLGGTALGWAGAKITSKGQQDEESAKKGYENERLKADLGYLSAKIKQEQLAAQNKKPRAAARLITD